MTWMMHEHKYFSGGWNFEDPMKKPFIIEQKVRRTVFGNTGFIEEWVLSERFKTREERDKRFEALQSLKYGTYRKSMEEPKWLKG